jgi:3-keto-5-aminohexanoate cleavage enzyme
MKTPLVIQVAPTGMVPRRADSPHVPLTPHEIAADVQRCFEAGARVFHLHARDENGEPTPRLDIFTEIVRRIRQTTPQAVLTVTTSGRIHKTFEDRSEVLHLERNFKPDMASLTLGSMNFIKQASINEPGIINRLAVAMTERGIVPELEIFDMGMLDYARYLIGKGILKPPFVFNLLLGSLGTLAATPFNLALLVERLPPGAFWAAAGIGRFQFDMNALGIVMNGHVRTGLEDNLYLDIEKRSWATNELLVQRLASLALAVGRPIATPDQARTLMGLSS